jgi:hypothetical protein
VTGTVHIQGQMIMASQAVVAAFFVRTAQHRRKCSRLKTLVVLARAVLSLLRPAKPRVLPRDGEILVVSAKPDVVAIVITGL